ncbi:hypothetical protein BDR05DRAFT_525511 [Suillus weaverae]|nr:hypothetical protein BDR05DRAFT_525511 [Suillus weaverae]
MFEPPSPEAFSRGRKVTPRSVRVVSLQDTAKPSANPLMTFYHIPVQTFFDFDCVFIILQITRFPNPSAPGVPGSGKNWALGAAAYIACWLTWTTMVFVLYELVYSFWRRWRVKRPLITLLYLSSAAFNLASMMSYTNFCFMQYIRFSAFFGENSSFLHRTCPLSPFCYLERVSP